ncbi:MAG TPA: CBS domain-containing protein [Amycolatopsis sp.]|uniref:CBS domain-containing protein n=1 Tax=Amycolatopsis sp. TaxID=37632 RepID=UPI002B46297B|nr:CBS domain-containing protein [Amycolatopsis sp.]HKS44926.1 CBS domain-containing protein [Amycolatopsis sp.]
MTPNPVTWPPDASVRQAAQRTREQDIGNALVAEGDRLRNIVTDWDIVVRGGAGWCRAGRSARRPPERRVR